MSDPRLILDANGSRLQFIGGEPLMDKGLENQALISLFTSPGWCGNRFLKTPIGSDFEQVCNQPITIQSLSKVRNSGERALAGPAFSPVTVTVRNPAGHRLEVNALLGRSGTALAMTRNGQNWEFQGSDPAYTSVAPRVPPRAVLDVTAILDDSILG
jgi:phage gp46-like protein